MELLEDSKELLRSSTRLGLKIPREMRMAQAGTGGPGIRSWRAEGLTPGWPEPAQTTPGYGMKHIVVPTLPSLRQAATGTGATAGTSSPGSRQPGAHQC